MEIQLKWEQLFIKMMRVVTVGGQGGVDTLNYNMSSITFF